LIPVLKSFHSRLAIKQHEKAADWGSFAVVDGHLATGSSKFRKRRLK
jgi:hypothetical protein